MGKLAQGLILVLEPRGVPRPAPGRERRSGQEEQRENPQAQSWRTVHPTDPLVSGKEWPVTWNRLPQPSRAQLFHVRKLVDNEPTLSGDSALTNVRLPPLRTMRRIGDRRNDSPCDVRE